MKLYEAMFLVDSSQAGADWEGIEANIKNILERAKAEVVSLKKWDERTLAYEIKRQSRGTYILCYFRAESDKITGIERDVQLSEQILRVLILSAEGREQDIQKETPATMAEKIRQERAQAAATSTDTPQADTKEKASVAQEQKQQSTETKSEVPVASGEPLEKIEESQESDKPSESEQPRESE